MDDLGATEIAPLKKDLSADTAPPVRISPSGETAKMVNDLNVPLLASLPMDPRISAATDKGEIPGQDPDNPIHDRLEPLLASIIKKTS